MDFRPSGQSRVTTHPEHPAFPQYLGAGSLFGSPFLEPEVKPESGADPLGTLEAELPAHEIDQLFGDRGAQARTAELAGGTFIGLGEFVEDTGLGGLGDTNAGIYDLKS